MSTHKDIKHKKGFSPTDYFLIKDSNAVEIDLIGNNWTAEVRVRRGYKTDAPVLETFSTSNGKLLLNPDVTGRIDFNFDGTEFLSETIKGVENSYNWDMQVTDGQSLVKHDVYEGSYILRSNL